MRKLTIPAVALITLLHGAASAGTAQPLYSDDASRVMWFLVMSDEHMTARNSDGPERLAWLLNDAVDIVEPEIIMNLGDLTDATNGEPLIPIYTGPQDDEWQQYRQIVDESGITVDRYVDLAGNHDQYSEKGLGHYLQYSLAGSTWNRTQHSITIEKPWGTYHFLGVCTAGNDGAIWPLDNAGLDLDELVYNQRALEDNAAANMTFVFGHHPVVRPDLGFKLNEGSDEFQEMMGENNVRAYFYGHTHEYRELYWPDNDLMPVTLQENVDSFGLADDNQVLLVSVDNDNMQLRQVTVQEFPWVIVTTPADVNQGGGNPWAVDVPTGLEQAPIRALGFTGDPFLSCEYRLDDGAWHPMDSLGNHLFQGFMDTRGMQPGNHTVEVRALPGPATGHKITFKVASFPCGNGVDEDADGLTDWPEDPGCDSVYDSDEYNDPVVVEDIVEPLDVIEEVFEDVGVDVVVNEDVIPDAIPDSAPDSVADVVLDAVFDAAATIDTAVDDGPAMADARDAGGDAASMNDATIEETGGDDDTGTKPAKDGGGCTAGSGGNPLSLLMITLVVGAFIGMRRSRRTGD